MQKSKAPVKKVPKVAGKRVTGPSTKAGGGKTEPPAAGWTFLSNHTHVLVCLCLEDMPKVRDIAERVGITERAVMRILSELELAGAITREREGRRSRYSVNSGLKLRHPLERECEVGDLLAMVERRMRAGRRSTASD